MEWAYGFGSGASLGPILHSGVGGSSLPLWLQSAPSLQFLWNLRKEAEEGLMSIIRTGRDLNRVLSSTRALDSYAIEDWMGPIIVQRFLRLYSFKT
jgi:hypothetical protein